MARFGRDMLTYAGADLMGSAIGLVLSPLFTRLFTPEQYGAQAAISAIWSFLMLAQFGGMDSAYPVFRSRTGDLAVRRRLLVSASFVAVGSALVVSGGFSVVLIATDWVTAYAGVSRREALTYAMTLAPGAVMAWFLYLLRYERRAMAFARVSLVGRMMASLVLVPVLMLTSVEDRLWASFATVAFATGVAALLGWSELSRAELGPFSRPEFERSQALAMWRFGIVLIPGYAVYAGTAVLDRLLVTWISGPAETALLALALRLGMVASMLKSWFALVWDPQLIDWVATMPHAALLARLQDAIGWISRGAFLVVCLAALWSQPVVDMLYPESYAPVASMLPWVAVGLGASTLSLVGVATTTLARTPRLHLPVYFVGFLVTLALGLWLVPKGGALGAVAAVAGGEATILLAWTTIGHWWLGNLPLRWWPALSLLILGALVAGIYRPGIVLPTWPLVEQVAATFVVLAVVGLPLVRRIWSVRATFKS
jgi:O-antigen/teichoic acid export membrane protein